MSKQAGLGDGFVVDGVDLSGDTGGLNAIGSSRPTQNVPGVGSSAQERLQLLKNGRIEWSAWFNPSNTPAPGASAHEELSTLPRADRVLTYLRGRSLGGAAGSMIGKQINYDPTREQDGSMTIGVAAQSNGFGLEWGRQLTLGFESFAAAGAGTGVDFNDVSTLFGLQAHAHLVSFTGTSVTISIEDSADDAAYAAIGAGVAFPALSAIGSARIQTDRDEAVRQFLRVALTGTFTEATIVVAVTRNNHLVSF